MNEKLRQLAMAASDPVYTMTGLEYQVNMEKLYELIVVESAGVADQAVDKSAGSGYVTKTTGERILSHFGITL